MHLNFTKNGKRFGILQSWFTLLDVAFCLVSMLQRGNPYGLHSRAGAWERESENRKKCKLLLSIYEERQDFL